MATSIALRRLIMFKPRGSAMTFRQRLQASLVPAPASVITD
jgi:hypothetical protein